jgi:hypothetical protein
MVALLKPRCAMHSVAAAMIFSQVSALRSAWVRRLLR